MQIMAAVDNLGKCWSLLDRYSQVASDGNSEVGRVKLLLTLKPHIKMVQVIVNMKEENYNSQVGVGGMLLREKAHQKRSSQSQHERPNIIPKLAKSKCSISKLIFSSFIFHIFTLSN